MGSVPLGCAHRVRLSSGQEKRLPVAGSDRLDTNVALPPKVAVDWTDFTTKGTALVRTDAVRSGTREVRIDRWGQETYAPYSPLNFIIRYIELPFRVLGIFIPPFGPACARFGHDHNGDGRTDGGEKLHDCLSFLNPFEGDPSTRRPRTRPVLRSRSTTREPFTEASGPLPEGPFFVRVQRGARTDSIDLRTGPDGTRTVDFAELLGPRLGDDVRLEVASPGGGPGESRALTLFEAAELVRRRDGVAPLAASDGRARQSLAEAYLREAEQRWDRGDRTGARELADVAGQLGGRGSALVRELQRRPLTLSQAVAAGLVTASVHGRGIESVTVEVTRTTPGGLRVHIPPGTFFVAGSHAQNMVATEHHTVDLTVQREVTVEVSAACANRSLPIPGSGTSFSVRDSPSSADLARAAPRLRSEQFAVKQAAVWIITDNATRDDLRILVRRRVGTVSGGTEVIGDQDVRRAARLLRQAGIDLSGKAIAGWLRTNAPETMAPQGEPQDW